VNWVEQVGWGLGLVPPNTTSRERLNIGALFFWVGHQRAHGHRLRAVWARALE